MRIFITGAKGQLGHELQRVLVGHDLVLADLPEFDICRDESAEHILSAVPEVVIHAAAYTDVEGAEREVEKAMQVNGEGTGRVARAAAKLGARLLAISTDYVFDGTKQTPYLETDRPNPLGAYARSKLEGERQAMAHCPKALIVRTSWLYGRQGKNFVNTIRRKARDQRELRVVADQRGCPTHAGDLAAAIAGMITLDLRGIVHAAGSGDCTWYEFACAIVSLCEFPTTVTPITTDQAGLCAVRPPYSVLANRVLARVGIMLPHWKDALSRYMREVKG
jgi:dTDP-4-dehydrorhamnose reductase